MKAGEVDPGAVLLFAGFRFDCDSGELFRRDNADHEAPIAIGPRAAALLRLLAMQPGRLFSKDAIIAEVWQGRIVEEANLSVQIAALRRLLDCGRDEPSRIQTVRGRGYRFVGPVTASASLAGPPLPDKPSIAVLPFQNLSSDPEQEYFADGMVEEIITALSRIRWLFVIARNSSFTYKRPAIDVKRVGRELGVRYVLEGSVRKAEGRVRITAQLIEADTAAHLWADRFEGSLADIFELQDAVASCVAGIIEPALQAAERTRTAAHPTSDLTAYDLYLRGYPLILGSERIPQALHLFEQAVALDPAYGPALALAALCCMRLCGEAVDLETNRCKGIDFARRALHAARDDPAVLANAAFALASFGEDLDAMTVLVDSALRLNPNYARGWHVSGFLRLWSGQLASAVEHAEKALRLNPRGQLAGPFYVIGMALLCSRRFDEAAAKLRIAIQTSPDFPGPLRALVSCYAHMGRLDEARQALARLRALTAVLMPDLRFMRDAAQRELLLSGLRLAIGERMPGPVEEEAHSPRLAL